MSSKGYTEPYGAGMDDWEASCLNASRSFYLVRLARVRELEDKVRQLEDRIKELDQNV